jgi:hypothetical protein
VVPFEVFLGPQDHVRQVQSSAVTAIQDRDDSMEELEGGRGGRES